MKLNDVRWGLIFAVLAILLGFTLGIAMGGAEDNIREYWRTSAQSVLPTIYKNDSQKVAAIIDRSWTSLIRAHLHAGAIGAACLVLIYILSNLWVSKAYKQATSLCLGVGSIGYPMAWLLTAFKAPEMGSVPVAKASVHWLAGLSIGMLLIGTIAVLLPIMVARFYLPLAKEE